MKNKRLGLSILAVLLVLALAVASLPGCQKIVNVPLVMGWHRLPNLLVAPGNVKVGDGYPDTAQDGEDLYVEGNAEIDGTLNLDGPFDLDGTGFDVDVTGAISLDADTASNLSTSGASLTMTIEAEAGYLVLKADGAYANAIHIDANETAGTGVDIDVGATNGLHIDGGCTNIGGGTPASCGDNDAYVTGDLEVDTVFDLDGSLDFDGSTFTVDGSGAISLDSGAVSNFTTSAGDITIESAVASVTIKGDEGAADAVYLDADETALGGVTIAANTGGVDVNLTAGGSFAIDGDLFVVGNAGADGDVADGDNDALVVGVLEVDGELEVDGTADINGAMTAVTTTFGTDGVGVDVMFYSDTAGDYMLWDTGGERLVIIGTDSATGFDLQDGDALINDDLTVTTGNVAISAGTLDVTAGATTVETMTVGTSGIGADVIFHSLTAGDNMLWDASDVALEITGTSAQNALEVVEGNFAVTLGNATIAAGNLDVTLGSTTVETTTVGVDAGGRDMTWHSLTTGDLMLWDSSAVCLDITGTAGQNAFRVLDGNAYFDSAVEINGYVHKLLDLQDKAADYAVTTTESGALFTNDGAGALITYTLPAPAVGLIYGFIAQDNQLVNVNPNAGETVLNCAAAGHSCQLDTQYDTVWLVSDGTDWLIYSVIGTLADAGY